MSRLNYFIADFYCSKKKAVIELDGLIHENTKEYDTFRDAGLKNLGISILHIRNEEPENMNTVLTKIKTFLTTIA